MTEENGHPFAPALNPRSLWWQWALMACGVIFAAGTSSGISFRDPLSLVAAVVLISLLNSFLRPALVFLMLPFVVISLGLGLLVINAVIFWLAGVLIPGFEVAGFWAALWGSIVLGITQFAVSVLAGPTAGPAGQPRNFRVVFRRSGMPPGREGQAELPPQDGPRREKPKASDDVIDI